jgi:hypothetical protein
LSLTIAASTPFAQRHDQYTYRASRCDATGPALPWLYVEKDADGRRAVQLERLVNEMT